MSQPEATIKQALIGVLAYDISNESKERVPERLNAIWTLICDIDVPVCSNLQWGELVTHVRRTIDNGYNAWSFDGEHFLTVCDMIFPCMHRVKRSLIGRRNIRLLKRTYYLQSALSIEWDDADCKGHTERSRTARTLRAPYKIQKWQKKVRKRLRRLGILVPPILAIIASYS